LRKKKGLEEWNKWFEENYDKLLKVAETYHSDFEDLVHHVYLRVYRQRDLTRVMKNPLPYFKRAMFVEATRGKFKGQYTYKDCPEWLDIKQDESSEKHFMLENIELITDQLNWFNKTVLHIWIDGYNICEVARESGIPHQVLHTSLHRTKKKIKDAIDRK
jgi:DNA-directed RNA polymerase specialized sigma24 family protein